MGKGGERLQGHAFYLLAQGLVVVDVDEECRGVAQFCRAGGEAAIGRPRCQFPVRAGGAAAGGSHVFARFGKLASDGNLDDIMRTFAMQVGE